MPTKRIFPLFAAAAMAAACSSRGPMSSDSNLTVSARGTPKGLVAASALQVSPALAVSRVRVVVKDVALEPVERPPATAMGRTVPMPVLAGQVQKDHGDGEGEDDDHPEGEIAVGPFLIDLSGPRLAGPVITAFDARIPAGTYRELRLRVAPLSIAEASAAVDKGGDTGLLDLAKAEASVAIDGTAGTGSAATSFSLAFPIRARVHREGSFTVGATTTNVTVPVDAAAWLAGIADPTSAAGRAEIAGRIRASLRIFVDDDEDGEADD